MNWTLVDIGIGLILVYLLMSIVCLTLNELFASIFSWRAKMLEATIKKMLQEKEKDFFDHGLIKPLMSNNKPPSYIPANLFASTVLDLILANGDNTDLNIKNAISQSTVIPHELKQALQALANQIGNSIANLQLAIEGWFDATMERLTGWYKKKVQIITFVCAIVFVGALNIDTLQIAKTLFHDPVVRQSLVTQTKKIVENDRFIANPTANNSEQSLQTQLDHMKNVSEKLSQQIGDIEQLGIPIGWPDSSLKGSFGDILLKILGLLITSLAVTLGAPFWFDILKKIVNIRFAGLSPVEKK